MKIGRGVHSSIGMLFPVTRLIRCVLTVGALAAGPHLAAQSTLEEDPRVQVYTQPVERPLIVDAFDGVLPHWVDGGTWKTTFLITNLDTRTAYFLMYFPDNSGKVSAIPLTGSGTVTRLGGQLEPNQSLEFETPGTASTLQQGAVQMFALDRPANDPSAQPVAIKLGGYAIFRQRVAGRPDFEAVVPFSPMFEQQFTLFFDNRSDYSTGVAVFNGGVSASPVTVTARDRAGNILLTDTFTLNPLQKLVFSVPDRYTALKGRAGVLQFSTTNLTLSGLGLRFNPSGSFTSSHTLSLP